MPSRFLADLQAEGKVEWQSPEPVLLRPAIVAGFLATGTGLRWRSAARAVGGLRGGHAEAAVLLPSGKRALRGTVQTRQPPAAVSSSTCRSGFYSVVETRA